MQNIYKFYFKFGKMYTTLYCQYFNILFKNKTNNYLGTFDLIKLGLLRTIFWKNSCIAEMQCVCEIVCNNKINSFSFLAKQFNRFSAI